MKKCTSGGVRVRVVGENAALARARGGTSSQGPGLGNSGAPGEEVFGRKLTESAQWAGPILAVPCLPSWAQSCGQVGGVLKNVRLIVGSVGGNLQCIGPPGSLPDSAGGAVSAPSDARLSVSRGAPNVGDGLCLAGNAAVRVGDSGGLVPHCLGATDAPGEEAESVVNCIEA